MHTFSKTNLILIGAALTLLLIATRGHHFASMINLPSATLAVFFLAGLYLRQTGVFAVLLTLCAALDFFAITFGGVSSFCVTPAYGFLLPAYGVIWLAGRWLAKRYSFNWTTILPLTGSLVLSAALSELFSSGGFYLFGGRYASPTLAEFVARLVKYFPQQLEGLIFWMSVAVMVHIAFALTRGKSQANV
jgi:hypothetical protein